MFDRLEDFHVFVTVAESGSFSAAARVLNLSPSTVSKLIARLERRFNVRAFDRGTASAVLTREGEIYLEHIRRVIDAAADLDGLAEALERAPHGTVRVHASLSFARSQIAPLLPEFVRRFPDVELVFRVAARFESLTNDMDVAVWFGATTDSSLVARKIATSRRILCATPAYIARHGRPRTPADLERHELLSYSLPGRESWPFLQDGRVREVPARYRVSADLADLLYQMARTDLGIARLPEFMVADDFRRGELVPLLEEFCFPEPIYAIYRSRRHLSARIRAFIDFLAESMRQAPWNLDRRAGAQ
ncbi:LysR family transcriptional regulator [Bordetella hinzii]|uniref:LysR family transcriptional regulator n=2 Tax=Bordetella hinzii TaxID=103855 RepID=UPI000404EE0F|nr:LysR family transcriptional regulator [Bordetella hinzii]AKQ55388.1 HTH-type transcriptional regulator DmlR [Bordetella hinzii]WPL80377.1 LysR family transcriptional regulator [Bordetella hinzii]SNV90911.1 LysR family transcriptional regulator [Bordetella hinzii]